MDDKEKRFDRGLTWVIIIMCILLVGFILTGCSPRIVERVETRIEYRDRVIHDTTTFEIPYEVEKIVTRDTMSHLENTYAKSDAVVSGGFLSHSLESKPQIIRVPYEVEVHDTLMVQKEAIEITKEVEVEKPLSWFKRFKIAAFWWLVLIALVGWRKEIFKLVKLII